MEEVNLRDMGEVAPDKLRPKVVYRCSEIVGYVLFSVQHAFDKTLGTRLIRLLGGSPTSCTADPAILKLVALFMLVVLTTQT